LKILVSDLLREFAERTDVHGHGHVPRRLEFFSSVPDSDASIVITTVTDRVGASEIDRLPELKLIANFGVGYDNIDVAYARSRGIQVTNTPGVLTGATAELTWALILTVARRIGEGERMVRANAWMGWQPTQLRGMSLYGKILGIIGAGRIGREVGRRASAFGMQVIYWGRTRHEGLEYVELDKLLGMSDIASIHLSRSAQTEGIIDARRLSLLRDGAILINTARGSIVDEVALIHELQAGRISAGLDVYTHEPRVPDELKSLENVVLLPHLGSATHEARQAMWDLAWGNAVAFMEAKPLLTRVE
jgi:glyoxylate reductase